MGLLENYSKIKAEISVAMQKSGRNSFPLLIAVTKTVPVETIQSLTSLGITDVGENYVQEMLAKMRICSNFNWHFIGTLQKNKVKYVVGSVKLIHSVDSLPLAIEINKRAEKIGKTQAVLVQINQGEATKGGVPKEELEKFVSELNTLNWLELKGLMAMPPYSNNPEDSRPYFREVRELLEFLNKGGVYKQPLTELSMGMSGDYTVAVEEGATILRIGTALFGERKR